MFLAIPAPLSLAPWIEGAVIVHLGPGAGVSRFPAMPQAMLTLRLARPDGHAAAAARLCPPITFHSMSTQPTAHAHAGGLTALGLLVRPGAAACLLGASSGAVVDQVFPWSDVAGAAEAERLEHEIERSTHDLDRVKALMDSLARAMAAVAQGRDLAYSRLCTAVGFQGLQAGDALGLGRRQLERRCQAVLGLSPKRFQRIVRFHRALSMAVTDTPPALTGVALEAGFYDQSHWARDARQLAGAPIGQLMAQARPDAAWWPLATRRGPDPERLASQWLPAHTG